MSLTKTLICFLYILDDWINDYFQQVPQNDRYSSQPKIYSENIINKKTEDLHSPFLMKNNLKSLDNGPYVCSICKKKYKYRRDLNRHMKSECINCPKNFQCNICDKAYFRFGHLQDHIKKRHRPTIEMK